MKTMLTKVKMTLTDQGDVKLNAVPFQSKFESAYYFGGQNKVTEVKLHEDVMYFNAVWGSSYVLPLREIQLSKPMTPTRIVQGKEYPINGVFTLYDICAEVSLVKANLKEELDIDWIMQRYKGCLEAEEIKRIAGRLAAIHKIT